jgi:microcystin-dependent protein
MVPIKLAQYADVEGMLHFVQYEDETHAFVYADDDTVESAQLRSWIQAGNTIGDYVPIISGGIIPVATIMWFCSQNPPEGYLLCDGREISRARYTQLFRAIGETFGSGDGFYTFNLPDLVGRFCRGWGAGDPLDEGREFGSYQKDEVGIHTHDMPPTTHTHGVTDPGHTHTVTDPGHSHAVTDPGHNHSVLDPGHQMLITEPITHQGWISGFSNQNVGCIRMGDPPSGWFRIKNFVLSTDRSEMVVASDPSNLVLANAQSNVATISAFTGITIDTAETNIPFTEVAGEADTRPDNIALLPVIRY